MKWIIFLVMVTAFFNGWLDRRDYPNRDLDAGFTTTGAAEVILKRNRMGHYVANGSINGVEVTFLLDTGATGVALSADVARATSVIPGKPVTTRTANGNATGYRATLRSVRLGNIEQRNVAATISPGLTTREVLLGMSFLKHLEMIQRGDTLTLRLPQQ
ncbi:MAG: TIGR02281 family clan AA aspartic protease [Alphaproteobacteria bacterium]|nr:TIGR02281 family clan AA aspartic protease [Alphaproteobacteria bacterium]